MILIYSQGSEQRTYTRGQHIFLQKVRIINILVLWATGFLATIQLCLYRSRRRSCNEWVCLRAHKILFTKAGVRLDLTCELLVLHPRFRPVMIHALDWAHFSLHKILWVGKNGKLLWGSLNNELLVGRGSVLFICFVQSLAQGLTGQEMCIEKN